MNIQQQTQFINHTPSKQYISQDTALKLAKRVDPKTDIKWNANIIENKELEIDNSMRLIPVWEVTAIYLEGNKMIIEIDAISGKQVSLK